MISVLYDYTSNCEYNCETGRSLEECRRLYFSMKDEVFVGSRPYDGAKLEGLLRHEFGDLQLADLRPPRFPRAPRLLVPVVRADTNPCQLILLRRVLLPSTVLYILYLFSY